MNAYSKVFVLLCLAFLSACVSAPLATPIPPTPTSFAKTWTAAQAIDAIKSAGLEIESPQSLTPSDYGLLPVANEGIRFKIPSINETGDVVIYNNPEEFETARKMHAAFNATAGFFFSWAYTKDNIILRLSNKLTSEKAQKYADALNALDGKPAQAIAAATLPPRTPDAVAASNATLQPTPDQRALETQVAQNIFATQTASVPTADPKALETKIAANIFATQTANAPQPTSTPKPAATSQAEPTAAPTSSSSSSSEGPLEILDTADITDNIGFTHIIGEVKNNSNDPYSFVKIVVTFYDASGKVVGTEFAYTALDVIPPGGKSPFDVVSTSDLSAAKRYVAQLDANRGGDPPQGLKITSHKGSYDSLGFFHIEGEVKNETSSPASFVKVIATLYDKAGKVTGTTFAYTMLDSISPGGTSPFEVTATLMLEGTDSYELRVQGQ